MGLKNVMRYLQQRHSVTPVTPENIAGLQPEPSVYAGCTLVTPVTPQTGDTQHGAQFVPIGKASNDPELTPTKPTPPPTAPAAPTPPVPQGDAYQRWHGAWKAQADAYYNHHFTCAVCKAAGKGYGSRCDLGETLWARYNAAYEAAAQVQGGPTP